MEWTKEKPKDPGYYWLKSLTCFPDGLPRIVELDSGAFFFFGVETESLPDEITDGEWAGPIEPPA